MMHPDLSCAQAGRLQAAELVSSLVNAACVAAQSVMCVYVCT